MKNINVESIKVSVIIPVYNSFKTIPDLLDSLDSQKTKPYEVIIIDSSDDNSIEQFISKKNYNFLLNYKKINKAYPGKARNIGVKIAKGNYLAFIDSRSIPNQDWLLNSLNNINKEIKCIIGSWRVRAKNYFQILLRATSHGMQTDQTLAGTLIEKNFFYEVGFFIENTRAGEDIEWINKLKKHSYNYLNSNNFNISYIGLPLDIFQTIIKYIVYSFHTSRVDVQQNIKNSYLIILLIISSIIIPKWNHIITGWDSSPLYVPNITKIYVIVLSTFLFIKIFIETIFSREHFNSQLNYFLTIILLFIAFYSSYKWNFLIANWMEDAVWYIPHIAKIFVFVTLSILLVIRGIILPLKRKIDIKFLFPLNWILVGSLGLLLDITKAPCYLLGSLTLPIIKILNIYFLSSEHKNFKKMLVLCPFPEGVQAGQRLKYEQHFSSFRNDNYMIDVKPFINIKLWKILYKKGYYFQKMMGMVIGYLKRLITIFVLFRYDVVYIFMWVTPIGPGYFEKIYRLFSKKIIYDIEDNILVIKENEINPTARFKSIKKIIYLIKKSDHIITSAPSLNEKCKAISLKDNCTYICASINLNKYLPQIQYRNKDFLTIGWTGTFSSKSYLDIVDPVFKELSKIRKFKLRIIGNFDYHIEGVNHEVIQWNKENEIKDLANIDIGFYPLNMDTDWVSGKSGLKALQYMALGIPTIATDIGNVSNIITNMENGILVKTKQDWLQAFLNLIDDPNLRKKIGIAGRETVKKGYSTDVLTKKYLKVLNSI